MVDAEDLVGKGLEVGRHTRLDRHAGQQVESGETAIEFADDFVQHDRAGIGDFGGDRVDRVGKQHHIGLAARIDNGVETGRLGDLERIGGDVGDDAGNSVDLPRGGAGVPTDDLDPCRDRLLDDWRLLGGVDRAENNASGLQSDRLGQRGRTRGDRALPVEDAEIPAHCLGGLLSAIADSLSSAVLLVGRDVDDQLPGLRLWAGGRTGPGRDWRGRLRDVFLGHCHERIISRLGQDDRQCDDCRRSQQAPANQTKTQHPFLPVRCWQTIGSPSRLSRRFSDGQDWPSITGNWAISLETRAALLAPSLDLARYELVERRCAGAARRLPARWK